MSRYTKRGQRERREIHFGTPGGRVGEAIRSALGGYELRGGEYLEIDVEHDDWCPHLRGGLCRCAPEAHVREWWRPRAVAS